MNVEIVTRPGARLLPAGRCRGFLRRLAREMSVTGGEIAVLFCDDAEMARINGLHRGRPAPTDVLAFPAGEGPPGPPGQGPLLGDIAVSSETVRRRARGSRGGEEREVLTLLVHGFLHLMGYDHETDDGEMLEMQGRLCRRLLPPVPARGGAPGRARGAAGGRS